MTTIETPGIPTTNANIIRQLDEDVAVCRFNGDNGRYFLADTSDAEKYGDLFPLSGYVLFPEGTTVEEAVDKTVEKFY